MHRYVESYAAVQNPFVFVFLFREECADSCSCPAEDGDGKWHLYFGAMNVNRLPESIGELNQLLFTKQVRPLVLVHDQALCR